MGLARELAERVCALAYESFPPQAHQWSKVAVLDTLGVALAGASEDAPRIVEAVLGAPAAAGPCLVLGGARRAAALDAALINGTAAHVLDYDNTARSMGGHVSAVMVPALLAAAEARGLAGRDLLLAHAAGYEVGAAIGRCVNPRHSVKGWHPTATLGVFAVAAGAARLLGLDVARTETALALATSLAAGTKSNFGTMTKPLHAGQCARGGLMAALLAEKGFTANPAAFEHKQGFFRVFGGADPYDPSRALAGWGEWEIVAPGASYKLYPCCYSTHSAIQAALNLVRRHGPFEPAALARVESRTHERALAHTDRPNPESPLAAKFSVQYCVSRALLEGRVVLEHFEGEAWRDPTVQAVLRRVSATAYTGKLHDEDDPFDAEVTVTLADGRRLTEKVDRPLGRTSANPIAPGHIKAKFEDCAARVLAPQAIAAVYRHIESLEDSASVRALTRLMEASGGSAAAAREPALVAGACS
ncbi:MAG: MmgE/PrpD family protein [Burkholderiales bacterium]|nr:MmgE/PrpD family protein [Burkholderiales bacterium]